MAIVKDVTDEVEENEEYLKKLRTICIEIVNIFSDGLCSRPLKSKYTVVSSEDSESLDGLSNNNGENNEISD